MKTLSKFAAVVAIAFGFGMSQAEAGGVFETGVVASDGGSDAIAGIPSTGNPFEIEDGGKAEITEDGKLEVKYKGLVRESDGLTTAEEVFASLVCDGVIEDSTESFPVNASGDAKIEDEVDLPEICQAPIVLIRRDGCTVAAGCNSDDPSNTRWLAVSGFSD